MLLYFLIGALFMLCAQPILSSLTDLICAVFETLQTKLSRIVAKDQLEIKKIAVEAANLTGEDEEEETRVIGFVAPEFEEEYDDEEGEDEDE